MRIVAGSRRGTKLLSPKGMASRPITDRVKESLFSVLLRYGLPAESTVADLFCGVGSLGLEALSRGAAFTAFVERDPATVEVLKKNIAKCRFIENSEVLTADAYRTGAVCDSARGACNLVFVDPPYADSTDAELCSPLGKLLELVGSQMAAGGFAVVRTNRRKALSDEYGLLRVAERRQWGTMAVTIFEKARE